LWGEEGIILRSDTTSVTSIAIARDDAGGFIAIWGDYRSQVDADLYGQRLDLDGNASWTAGGIPVCSASGSQRYPRIVSDGSNGAIFVWQDDRNGDFDIYAQRVDATGACQWATDGVPVCAAYDHQQDAKIVSDGSGGAIVAWQDERRFWPNVYCQRIDSNGDVLWAADGIIASGGWAYWTMTNHRLVSDGAGGTIIVWDDNRGGTVTYQGVFAQRIGGSGAYLWGAEDVCVCDEAGDQNYPAIVARSGGRAVITFTDWRLNSQHIFAQVLDANGNLLLPESGGAISVARSDQQNAQLAPDGAGGAIAVWRDGRSLYGYSLYAQRFDENDGWYTADPVIASVKDIAPDQGGWVRIRLNAAMCDDRSAVAQVTYYAIWRRISGIPALESIPVAAAGLATGIRISPAQAELLGLPPGFWESLGMYPAMQAEEYYLAVPTDNDSTAAGIPWETYVVSAHTASPNYFVYSEPDSGYSVDNLVPGAPLELEGEQQYDPEGLRLTWSAGTESDLWYYAVYRGTSEEFTPEVGNRVASTTAPEWFDEEWSWNGGFWYKVSSIDRHGNASPYATLGPEQVTGHNPGPAPEATYLGQNYPNPFNPSTAIAFGLKARGHVSLRIFESTGRLIATLVDEVRPAGRYTATWRGVDSEGRAVSSGIYYCKITAEDFTATRKLVLVK
jgi:hypothetical protein